MKIFSLLLLCLCLSGCVREPATSRLMRQCYHPSKPVQVHLTWAEYGPSDRYGICSWSETGSGESWGYVQNGKVYTDRWVHSVIAKRGWPIDAYAVQREHGVTGRVILRIPLASDPVSTNNSTIFTRWR